MNIYAIKGEGWKMNNKKMYEVTTQETVTRVYAIQAENESDAATMYDNGEIVSEKVDSFEVQDIEEVPQ